MKRRLFKKIFIIFGFILLGAILSSEVFITEAIRDEHIASLKHNLSIQAALIADRIAFNAPVDLDNLCKHWKERTGARVTVVGLDGRVIGDSDADSASMENHALRPEIQQASLMGTGMFIRYSDTVRHDLLYVAYQARSKDAPSGYVRLSITLHDVEQTVNRARMKILFIVSFVILATGIVSFWQLEYLRRLTGQIKDFAKSLVSKGIGRRLVIENAGEFSEIADSLNAMSEELKNVITEHEQERKRLNEILRSIPDALIIIDSNGVVILSSAATRSFFGDTPLLEKPFIQVVRNSEFFSLLDEVRATRTAGVTEFRLEYPEERYCIVRISPLMQEKNLLSGFVAIFHDITQLKKVEQVRKDFIANASHEIKTPITAIIGFADTLLEGALDDRGHAVKFLKTIKSNSERINSLVDDLMTISKIEMGVMKIDKTPVRLHDVAESVQTLLREKAAAKNLFLNVAIKPELDDVSADRDRLTQILTNLVENGIKFTEQGGVTFGIDREDDRIFVFVEDTGIGIQKQFIPRLGERFYRVDPGRSRNMGGTGLGLAIVKHLVKAHGWDLQIESTPGKGTKVRIVVS